MADERKQNQYNPKHSIEGGGAQEQQEQQKVYADKVDLNDLDWEDRERVLRLLFSKINTGVKPAQNWKQNQPMGEPEVHDLQDDMPLSITDKDHSEA